jgi:hemoglobin
MRHITFPIGESERDQWMLCMIQAMREVIEEEALREELKAAFYKTADFMRNK